VRRLRCHRCDHEATPHNQQPNSGAWSEQTHTFCTAGTAAANENENVDDWAESDLAWELADAISPRLTDRDRAQLYATLGSGDSYTAIDTVLQTMAHQSSPIAPELVAKLTDWLDAYTNNDDAPRLRELLRAIRSLRWWAVEELGTSAEGGYSMQVGDADAGRLKLLGRFYDPSSAAFIESAGVAAGDSVADLGCGHGAVTERIAARVGDTGTVYAVDASPDQLQIARSTLAHRRNVTFVEGAAEDDPLGGVRVDWVYSRFLLMHVSDVRRALLAMADMLTDSGALLLEIADVGSLRFLPSSPDSDVWRPWWYALGRSRGASYDVAERIEELLDQTGFAIHRCDRYQPVAASAEAKLVHALGFDQCAPAYLNEIGAPADQIDAHYAFLRRAVNDPTVMIALFSNTQYVARPR
jgi:SAM-dependent methyltransferase